MNPKKHKTQRSYYFYPETIEAIASFRNSILARFPGPRVARGFKLNDAVETLIRAGLQQLPANSIWRAEKERMKWEISKLIQAAACRLPGMDDRTVHVDDPVINLNDLTDEIYRLIDQYHSMNNGLPPAVYDLLPDDVQSRINKTGKTV